MPVRIESTSNAVYKHINKLNTKSARSKYSQYIAEGKRAVFDALKNGADIDFIAVSEDSDFEIPDSGVKTYVFSKKLFDMLKNTVNSQGIIAVINYRVKMCSEADMSGYTNIVYLDSVTDPGNMGTILRSADALGADAIILGSGCVDIFNPKVVRSSMASILNIPVFEDDDFGKTFEKLKNLGFQIIATLPDTEIFSCDVKFENKTVLIMGNEANGIRKEIACESDVKVKIPMVDRAESLNVATAATVMLYEIMRQKMKEGM